MNEIKECTEILFDNIKNINKNEVEYWCARELQNVLGYNINFFYSQIKIFII